jgi:acetyl esterase/lipase
MIKLIQFLFITILLTPYGKDDNCIPPNPQNEIPTVQSSSTYKVTMEEDIIYAEGLSHESVNSASTTKIPLKLDVYVPDNNLENRPVYMFIHGGGFIGGSKQQSQIKKLANYYASRGWVFISIDYRLRNDNGAVPQKWTNYSANVPRSKTRQFLAIYPAVRDAKAALRWVIANSDTYKINTNYITVGGGSAGAITAIAIGISNQEDFKDEMDSNQDPTLISTNPDQSYQVRTIIDFWGAKVALDFLQKIYGHQRFDSNDPSLFIVHGTEDNIVPFSKAENLKTIYEANGLPIACYPLEGLGHGVWNATVNNKRLEELAFDFIVEQQNLIVE